MILIHTLFLDFISITDIIVGKKSSIPYTSVSRKKSIKRVPL